MPAIRHDVREELVKRLSNELDYYKAIVDKFIKNYGSLRELESKIEDEEVPSGRGLWEDWKNAVKEVEKLENIKGDSQKNSRIKV